MSPSDFLTILGLALAVWAIIPSKERRFILLFFSKYEIGLFIALLFFIHYLISFDWIMSNWFPCFSLFTCEKGIPSTIWAYIISLTVIIYPVVKVSYCYFSSSRLIDLISLYESLLKENEIDLLVNYINKYHVEDIKKYLQRLSHLPQKETIDIVLNRETNKDVEYKNLVRSDRMRFARLVYEHIFQDESFVHNAANKYPELFAIAFSGMETEESSNEKLVKLYVKCLFEEKNQSLIKELRIMNNVGDSVLGMSKINNVPILFSLFAHTNAAAKNYVWYPVGEGTIRSLKYDSDQKDFLMKRFDSDLETELWNQKIYIAIVYFNYMVRETIYRYSDWHMWLFYFKDFTNLMIEIIPNKNSYEEQASDYDTFAHNIIEKLLSIINDWLELSIEQEKENQVFDITRCLGSCIYSICRAGSLKISDNFKQKQVESILTMYFKLSKYHNNNTAKTIRERLEKLFLNPEWIDIEKPSTSKEYLAVLKDAWKGFDKFNYQVNGGNGSTEQFETNVLIPLGIIT